MLEFLANAEMIASLVIFALSLVSLILTIVKAIKNGKYDQILTAMIGFIEDAENYKCKNGESVDGSVKKEIVLSKVSQICKKLNYKFKEETWSTIIDKYVEFSKVVNARPEIAQDELQLPIEEQIQSDIESDTKVNVVDV